ncbi:hypothetical protein L6164_001310 [Bauhinia variegata]|uniref:Uncharacterized protein n=1 Tax=Bauhinia variegata TaxID=167791 RepID=A0ACB9Q9F3_BAUVA|nr:hypothetical protein L6164_001310 [Bauhinia variegata]
MDFLNAIYFLRRIRSHNLEEGKLQIPKKFVRKYGKGLLNPLVLQLPNGSKWVVHWEKCKNQTFLEKGWRKFAVECSLAPGHRLLFRYEKGSIFHVLIFDRTSLQIKYPEKKKPEKAKSSTRKKRAGKRAGNGKGNFPLEKFPKYGGRRKGKVSNTKKSSDLEKASQFRSENPRFSVVMQPSYVNRYILNLPSNFSKQHMGAKNGCASLMVSGESRTWTIKYHFNLATKQSILTTGWKAFARDNKLKVGDICVFELINRIDMSFVVTISHTREGSICPQSQAKSAAPSEIDRGRLRKRKSDAEGRSSACDADFLQERAIKHGKFEPLDNRQPMPASYSNEALNSSCNLNPLLKIVIRPSYVGKTAYLNFPSNFSSQHMGEKGFISLRLSDDLRTWTIKYCSNVATKQSMLTSGWRSFASDNKLKVGDVCVFELINSIEILFNVSISRAGEELNCPQPQAKSAAPSEIDRGRLRKRKSDAEGRSSACDADFLQERGIKNRKFEPLDNRQPMPASYSNEALNSSCNLNPLLKIVIRPSYVGKTAYLNFPSNFSSQHMGEKGFISLRLSDDLRTWTIKYCSNLATKQSMLTSGWRSFASDNKLKVGDVCVFELINSIEMLFNVSISRAGEELNCPQPQAERSDPPEADQGQLRKRNTIKQRSSGLNADMEERNTGRGMKFQKLGDVESRQATPANYTNKALRSSCNVTSEIPSFTVAMRPAYISGRAHLYIPFDFAERYLRLEKDNGDAILQLPNGKVWSVQYKCRRGKIVEFISGWKNFMVDNKLEVGDACIFYLIDEIKITLQVILLRGNASSASFPSPESARCSSADEVFNQKSTEAVINKGSSSNHVPDGSSSHCCSNPSQDQRGGLAINPSSTLSNSKVHKIFEAAGKSIPKNPFFTFNIRTATMMHNIPNGFILSYLKDKANVSLRAGNKTWPVKLIYYPKHLYGRFSAGWPAFVRECKLQIGDVCIFELINKDDAVLEVSILKTSTSY